VSRENSGESSLIVKVDAQGTDHVVLAGMTNLINPLPPPLVFTESWPLGIRWLGAAPRRRG
jgi:hypothetical protein